MKRSKRGSLLGEKGAQKRNSLAWPREIILYVLLIFVFVASSAIFIFQTPSEEWPDIIDYIISNPLTVSIIGALVVFLILDRFRDLSKSIGNLDDRVHDQQGSFQRELENRVDETQRKLSDKWQRIETKLGDISQTYPFLEDINNYDILVNAPTAVAALKNIEILIASDRPNLAYHIIHQVAVESDSSEERFSGSPNQFETLGLLALALFDDSYLCDRLFIRASRGANERGIVWAARRLQLAALTGRVALVVELSEYLSKRLSERYWLFLPGKANIERILAERDVLEIKTALALSEAVKGSNQSSSIFSLGRKNTWPVPTSFDNFCNDVLTVAGIHSAKEQDNTSREYQAPSRSAAAMLELIRLKHTGNVTAPQRALSELANYDPLIRNIFYESLALSEPTRRRREATPARTHSNVSSPEVELEQDVADSDIVPGYDTWKADNPEPYTTNPEVTARILRERPSIKPSRLFGMKHRDEDQPNEDESS